MHAAYQATRYAEVLARLPDLCARLAVTRDARVLAAGWTVVAKVLTKVGAGDLALLTADRACEGARRSGDRADLGMATYQVVCALMSTSRAARTPSTSQVGLDLAWAHTCRRQDAEAVLALMDVERRAPNVTRHNVYARSTIGTLLGRARGSTAGHVRALAARNGIAP